MEEREFKIKSNDNTFRIKKMNAIQVLAIQQQVAFDGVKQTEDYFKIALENIEVKLNNQWFPVKEKNREVYWPDSIEENINSIQELISYFTNDFLLDVFRKSAASKKDTK